MAATNFKFLNFKTEEKPPGLKGYRTSPFYLPRKEEHYALCVVWLCAEGI